MAKTKAAAKAGSGPDLSPEKLLKMYRDMVLTRMLDERMWLLNRAGKAPFIVPCSGQEATQIGWASAMRPTDAFLPYYRDMGVVVALGMSARDLMLSLFARAEDPNSGGRQMPGHFGSRKLNIITGSSPVTTQVLHAVGIAYAAKLRGEDTVAAAAHGEGSASQGDFHEALNWASIYKLPVIFVIENNEYAISVPVSKEMAVDDVADRAQGYGMPGVVVDGNDVLQVYSAMYEAVERARAGGGPTLLECKTYRLNPHSSDDDDRAYRSREEVEEWRKKDPIQRFRAYLLEKGLLTEADEAALLQQLRHDVDEATDYAENAPYPVPEDALKHVYAE